MLEAALVSVMVPPLASAPLAEVVNLNATMSGITAVVERPGVAQPHVGRSEAREAHWEVGEDLDSWRRHVLGVVCSTAGCYARLSGHGRVLGLGAKKSGDQVGLFGDPTNVNATGERTLLQLLDRQCGKPTLRLLRHEKCLSQECLLVIAFLAGAVAVLLLSISGIHVHVSVAHIHGIRRFCLS